HNNTVNAYEISGALNNHWNLSDIGNFWDDFEINEGYPDTYIVPGPGDGVDYHPNKNYPPVLEPFSNITVSEMGSVIIRPVASDPNGDVLTYSIDNSVFTWNGVYFLWKTGPSSSGEYDFTVNVTDGFLWDTETVHVTVRNKCTVFNKKYWCWEGCTCHFIDDNLPAMK
ncbi:MAG: hypothetical protein ABH950_02180, partial [Candidatus Altiarchaeota archaeon]